MACIICINRQIPIMQFTTPFLNLTIKCAFTTLLIHIGCPGQISWPLMPATVAAGQPSCSAQQFQNKPYSISHNTICNFNLLLCQAELSQQPYGIQLEQDLLWILLQVSLVANRILPEFYLPLSLRNPVRIRLTIKLLFRRI